MGIIYDKFPFFCINVRICRIHLLIELNQYNIPMQIFKYETESFTYILYFSMNKDKSILFKSTIPFTMSF